MNLQKYTLLVIMALSCGSLAPVQQYQRFGHQRSLKTRNAADFFKIDLTRILLRSYANSRQLETSITNLFEEQ